MHEIRHDWTLEEIGALFEQPFNDLLFRAHTIHRAHHDPNGVQISTLLSIKTGACPEDCSYCSQSARNDTDLERETLLPLDEVMADPQVVARGMQIELDGVPGVRAPFRFSDAELALHRPAPKLGEDSPD